MKNIKNTVKKLQGTLKRVSKDNSGSQLVGTLVVILIVVIIGGLALKFSETSFNELGPLVVNKLKSLFSL